MFRELYIVHFNHFSIPRCGDQCTRWCSNYVIIKKTKSSNIYGNNTW